MSFLISTTTRQCVRLRTLSMLTSRSTSLYSSTTTSFASRFFHAHTPTSQPSLDPSNRVADTPYHPAEEELPGSRAFVECDRNALIDLFHKYAVDCDVSGRYLDLEGLRKLLRAVGENLDQATLERLFETADINGDGTIELTVRSCMILQSYDWNVFETNRNMFYLAIPSISQ